MSARHRQPSITRSTLTSTCWRRPLTSSSVGWRDWRCGPGDCAVRALSRRPATMMSTTNSTAAVHNTPAHHSQAACCSGHTTATYRHPLLWSTLPPLSRCSPSPSCNMSLLMTSVACMVLTYTHAVPQVQQNDSWERVVSQGVGFCAGEFNMTLANRALQQTTPHPEELPVVYRTHYVCVPVGISIGLTVYSGLTIVTNWHTCCPSVPVGRISRSACGQPNDSSMCNHIVITDGTVD